MTDALAMNIEQQQTEKKVKKFGRYITRREAVEAYNRLRTAPDGSRYVIRFSPGQRIEHLALIISFTLLGITGLSQTFYDTQVGGGILNLLGGIDAACQVHHFFAFLFGVQTIYHVWLFLYRLIVHRHRSKILPDLGDAIHLLLMLRLNLGLVRERPHFDRYTFEEKAGYWALVIGTLILGVSGLMQWFPILVTEILPGWAIPVARSLHKWQAILSVLAILTWHFYHVLLKKFNKSIFTGIMSVKDMEEEHPAELLFLEKAAAVVGSKKWPVFIDLSPAPVSAHSKTKKSPAARKSKPVEETQA